MAQENHKRVHINPEKRFKDLTLLYLHNPEFFQDEQSKPLYNDAKEAIHAYLEELHGGFGVNRLLQYAGLNLSINDFRANALIKVSKLDDHFESRLNRVSAQHVLFDSAQQLRNEYFPQGKDLLLPMLLMLGLLAIPAGIVLSTWLPVVLAWALPIAFMVGFVVNQHAITKDFNDFQTLANRSTSVEDKAKRKFDFYARYLVHRELNGDEWTFQQKWDVTDDYLSYFLNPVNCILFPIIWLEIGLLQLGDRKTPVKDDTPGFPKDFKQYAMMAFALVKAPFHCLVFWGSLPYQFIKMVFVDTPLIGFKSLYHLFAQHGEYSKLSGDWEMDYTALAKPNLKPTYNVTLNVLGRGQGVEGEEAAQKIDPELLASLPPSYVIFDTSASNTQQTPHA